MKKQTEVLLFNVVNYSSYQMTAFLSSNHFSAAHSYACIET